MTQSTRETLQELVDAARDILGPDLTARYGYRAAANILNDAKRARLVAAVRRSQRRLAPGQGRGEG